MMRNRLGKCPSCGGKSARPSLKVPGRLYSCGWLREKNLYLKKAKQIDPYTCCECCEKQLENKVPCNP